VEFIGGPAFQKPWLTFFRGLAEADRGQQELAIASDARALKDQSERYKVSIRALSERPAQEK
jgi:hypothetical protein